VRSFDPHLMVLDIMLPDMEGFEVAERQYRLLRYLLLNPRRVLTRAQLLDPTPSCCGSARRRSPRRSRRR
jgi:DNA-binding response OmpR family regulator